LHERVELNAMTSDAFVAMIERKLQEYGLTKVIPDDAVLRETYLAFHRSRQLKERFAELERTFEASTVKVPKDLRDQVCDHLRKHPDLRWDEAVKLVLNADALEEVRIKKLEDKRKSGDFTDTGDDEEEP
jgi:hypothetical protein